MSYILMLRDEEAAVISIKDKRIVLKEVLDYDRLPILVQYTHDKEDALNAFFMEQTIPMERKRIKELLKAVGVKKPFELAMKNRFLSLMHQFWIRDSHEEVHWEDVNLFENSYKYDTGNYMLGLSDEVKNMLSPDITTGGNQPKSWRRNDFGNCLFKSGAGPYNQEPSNEVFVSEIAREICRCRVVEYKYAKINGLEGCYSQSFLNEHTTLVTANDIFRIKEKIPSLGAYDHLCDCCSYLGIKGYREFFNSMIAFDYIIMNIDRNLGNFGFLYDTEKLKFIGPAPLYDNGTSLWSDMDEDSIKDRQAEASQPFFLTQEEQIELVGDIDAAVSVEGLKNAKSKLMKHKNHYKDPHRAEVISKKFDDRVDLAVKRFDAIRENSKAHRKFRDLTGRSSSYER